MLPHLLGGIKPNLMKTLKQQDVGLELSKRSEICSNSTEAPIRFWNNSIIQTHNIQVGILPNFRKLDAVRFRFTIVGSF